MTHRAKAAGAIRSLDRAVNRPFSLCWQAYSQVRIMEYLLRLSDLGTSATPDAFVITFEGPHPDTIMIGQIRSIVYLIDPISQVWGSASRDAPGGMVWLERT